MKRNERTTGRNTVRRGMAAVGFKAGRWLTALVFLGLAGCAMPDRLKPAVEGRVREGMTRSEVQALMGNPTSYEQGESGVLLEVYEAIQTIFGQRAFRDREEAVEIRQFSVRYDRDGRVTRTLYHRGVLEGLTMIHSYSLGREIEPETVAQIRSGRTTRSEVDRLLGPATTARLDLEGGVRLEWIYDVIESSAVIPGRAYRSLEVLMDETGVVRSVRSIDRIFPAWRQSSVDGRAGTGTG